MGGILVHEFTTLDGVIDAPTCLLTRGTGLRLFPEDAAPLNLALVAAESYANGAVHLAYEPQG